VSNEGALADSVQERDTFIYRIQNYKPNLFNFQPDLGSLSMALEIASRPTLDPLGKRAIVLVTPLPLDQSLSSLAVMRARAIELRVPINVWLVAPETAVNAPAAAQLNELAVSTGGRFLFYPENLQQPDVEDFVSSLRQIYRLRYTSAVSQSGAHQVRVEATYGSQKAVTPDTQFAINLNMPTAVLTGLPDEIQRRYEAGPSGRALQPGFITVQAEIIFPDGYERQLKATRFYVDGVLTAENKQEPYGVFAWPLSNYQFSGEHLLSVEVEDILGFRNISPPVSVMVTVETLYPSWLTATLKYFNSGGWIPLAIAALGLTVFFSLRLRSRRLNKLESGGQNGNGGELDPLLQQVAGLDSAEGGIQANANFNTRVDFEEQPPCLICTGEGDALLKDGKICMDKDELIIGSDPAICTFLIHSESISARHAKLLRQASGAVLISDLGSETGTWVNFAPVSNRGIILNQNDLVLIGSVEFRYQIGRIKAR
jgi:hypothetical protein